MPLEPRVPITVLRRVSPLSVFLCLHSVSYHSASRSNVQAAHAEPSHTHTHTLSLSLSLSLSPLASGGRAINTRHSASSFRSIARSLIRAHIGSTAFLPSFPSNSRVDFRLRYNASGTSLLPSTQIPLFIKLHCSPGPWQPSDGQFP